VALRVALFLLTCGLLLSAAPKSNAADHAKCVAQCTNRCNQNFDSCKKNAKNKTAMTSCQKSRDLCGGICLNKTCGS
jgi:hypothetical protein